MHINRRNFIRQTALSASGTLLVPQFLQALHGKQHTAAAAGEKVVVIIQLSGGNDGLNTIIPYRNDIYYKTRPGIGISRQQALNLNDETGIHPQLSYFKTLYDEGALAVLNGVGYPNPDRSHFRSMDIWHTASDSQTYLQTGWLGRYLDAQCNHCHHPTQILEFDDLLSLALKGENYQGIATRDPARLFATGHQQYLQKIADHEHHHEPMADYLYKTLTDTLNSADYLYKEMRKNPATKSFPDTALGKQLKTVASLIKSDVNTRVYYLSLGSFDTHINQLAQQKRLFTELNDAVAAFVQELKAAGKFNDVLLFTFSEFGRRVNQNASGGTDHGTANNMFFISGALKKQGLVNPLPDLAILDNNDLKFTVDFRSVYQMVLKDWLRSTDKRIVPDTFAGLQII